MPISADVLLPFPIFDHLSRAERADLALLFEEQEVSPYTELIRQSDPDGPIWLVLEGTVVVTRRLPDGGDLVLGRLKEGRLIGYLVHIDGLVRSATIHTTPGTRVARMDAPVARALLAGISPLAVRFQVAVAREITRSLRYANRRMALAATLPADSFLSPRHLDGLYDEPTGEG